MNRLEQIATQIESNDQPPVDKWTPAHVGDIDIQIDEQGNWFHEGEQIKRDKLVVLFASILWAESGEHYLVTPAEKLAIKVSDVPFMVHQMEYVEGAWVAVTNTHEQIIIGQDNPVELREYQGQMVPYINVRYDLWARVNRSIFYQWVDVALNQHSGEPEEVEQVLALESSGYRFEVARVN